MTGSVLTRKGHAGNGATFLFRGQKHKFFIFRIEQPRPVENSRQISTGGGGLNISPPPSSAARFLDIVEVDPVLAFGKYDFAGGNLLYFFFFFRVGSQ